MKYALTTKDGVVISIYSHFKAAEAVIKRFHNKGYKIRRRYKARKPSSRLIPN